MIYYEVNKNIYYLNKSGMVGRLKFDVGYYPSEIMWENYSGGYDEERRQRELKAYIKEYKIALEYFEKVQALL